MDSFSGGNGAVLSLNKGALYEYANLNRLICILQPDLDSHFKLKTETPGLQTC